MQCASGAAGKRLDRPHALGADHQHFARLDVAHVGGADQIERAGLRADDLRVAEPSERERPEAVRIAHGDQLVLGEQHQRERARRLIDPTRMIASSTLAGLRPRVEMQHHFGVAVRLEDRSGADQPLADLVGVDEVAVVADGDLAVRAVDQDRLRVRQLARPPSSSARGRWRSCPGSGASVGSLKISLT